MLRFMCIGTQKGGTTWLYHMLQHHPAIRFPAGRKEVHYWDGPGGRSLAWYRQLFEGPGCHGDVTPAYQILDVATIRAIREAFPDLRLILLMRNPVERAWSSAKMALGRAEMTLPEASEQWFIDHFRSQGSLRRGDYETAIRNWRGAFPAEQLMILRYERIAREPVALLGDVARHLGIEPRVFEGLPPGVTSARIFATPSLPLPPRLRAELNNIYRDKVISLQNYLGTDLGDWLSEQAWQDAPGT